MGAFNDARCTRCGRRNGWTGRYADRPPCPKCGFRPPRSELEAIDRELEEMERKLFEKGDKDDEEGDGAGEPET